MSEPPPSHDRHDTDVDLLILCLGSRGDVQPFLNLAACLAASSRSWRVVVACDNTYRGLVEQAAAGLPPASSSGNRRGGAVLHATLGGSFTEAMKNTPAGRALREARSIKAALAAAEDFFSPLARVWSRDVRALCREHRPRLVLHSTFTLFAAFAAPFYASVDCRRLFPQEDRRHWYTPRVAVAHTVPSHPTKFFLPPTTGRGFQAPFALLNRLAWWMGFAGAHRAVYAPLTRAAGEELTRGEEGEGGPSSRATAASTAAAAPLLPTWRDAEAAAPTPTFYVWSPALVPRPDDWPKNAVVVGAQLTAAQEEEAAEQGKGAGQDAAAAPALLPADLRALLSSARAQGRPVVLATLGSMLGAVLEGGEAQRALEALVKGAGEAVQAAVAGTKTTGPPPPPPPVVVVHATTGKRDGEDEAARQQQQLQQQSTEGQSGGGSASGGGPDFDLPALTALAAEVNAAAAAAVAAAAAGGGTAAAAAAATAAATAALPAVHLLTRPCPHALLMPRCDLVLHHCGAGTTHAALAAGVPSLPLPCAHASDQPWWADVLRKVGAAPPKATRRRGGGGGGGLPPLAADLTPGAFAAALATALAGFGGGGGRGGGGDGSGGGGGSGGDGGSGGGSAQPRHAEPYLSLKRSAERVGARVRADRGTATLAAELERVLDGPPAPPPPAPWGPFF